MTAALEELARALGPIMEQQKGRRFGTAFKHDLTLGAGEPDRNQYSHGATGLLTFPGVDPVMFSAALGADSIIDNIPVKASLETNPTYYTLTGVRADSGEERNGVCDDAPEAGLIKACLTTSVFGKYARATPILDIQRLGARTDRADPMDLRLVGSPISTTTPFGGIGNMGTPSDLLTNEVSRKFWERNVALHRLLSHQIWQGTPTSNSAGGGYKEMTGLQVLVNTGYADAESGVACPAMDSHVVDFNHQRTDSAAGATNLVSAVTNQYRQLKNRARRARLAPVRWVLAMRESLFYELTSIWPCTYLTMRCLQASSSNPNNIDAQDAVRFRDEMRSGNYLLLDGDRVDVVMDDGIPEDDGNESGGSFPGGCFESDIYFLPMSVVGGQSVLFMEYFQYNNPSIQDALGNMVLARIEGAWITYPRQKNLCIQWESEIQPRMVLRTPWLAGKIQNVVYCPVEHTQEPFPEDPYFKDGGKSERVGPSYTTLWSA